MDLKILLVVLLALAVGAAAELPTDRPEVGLLSGGTSTESGFQGIRRRRRRMSCDALTFPLPYGYMNHAACASYCFVTGMNFRGHCEFGWCKCK